jgi:quercetin dioxygenase-like cupin family protein
MPYYDWSSQSGEEVAPGDRVWSATGNELQVIRAELSPGSDFPIHTHPQEQFIVVLAGALRFTVGDVQQVVRAGGVIHAPSGIPHGGGVFGEETVITIEAFYPPRKDFRPGRKNVDLSQPQ